MSRDSNVHQRFQAAAERIRSQAQAALDSGNDYSLAKDAANVLGLEIRIDSDGKVTVGRSSRE